MRLLVLAVGVVGLSGCGQKEPLLAGGKPVSYWVRALHDPDPGLRKKAAFKLGNVGTADAAAFPALLGSLQDVDAAVRCEAIRALLKFGPDAREAIPALTRVQHQDADDQVRTDAARALARIRGASGRAR